MTPMGIDWDTNLKELEPYVSSYRIMHVDLCKLQSSPAGPMGFRCNKTSLGICHLKISLFCSFVPL